MFSPILGGDLAFLFLFVLGGVILWGGVFLFLFFFLFTITRSGCLAEIRWSVCISKSQLLVCYSPGCILVFAYDTGSYGQIYIHLHNSQWITFPTQFSFILLCANLLHSLMMWLIISSLLPHNQHLLFSCILSVFAMLFFIIISLEFLVFLLRSRNLFNTYIWIQVVMVS